MANKVRYKVTDMKAAALEAIKKYRLFTLTDLAAYVPFTMKLFYIRGLNKDKEILEEIQKNKVVTKNAILKKWYDGNSTTAQLFLFKLCCTKEERDALVYEKHEVTGANGSALIPTSLNDVDISNLTEEEKAVLVKIARQNGIGK